MALDLTVKFVEKTHNKFEHLNKKNVRSFFYLSRLTEVMETTTGANQQEVKRNTNLSFVHRSTI